MPLYRWVCEHCKAELDIFRSFADYADTPKEDDPDYPRAEEGKPECEHEWKKELGKFHLTRGGNWKGAKGHW